MSWLLALPSTAAASVLALFGVPQIYQNEAVFSSVALLGFLLALSWVLFRGYRDRIVGPHQPWHMVGYVAIFVAVDHLLNLYCFLSIEAPLECPWVVCHLGSYIPYVVGLTTMLGLKYLFIDWVTVSIALRLMGCRLAWSLGARIAVYSLPATLILALPGAESWRAALIAWVVAQVFTLWRLRAEKKL